MGNLAQLLLLGLNIALIADPITSTHAKPETQAALYYVHPDGDNTSCPESHTCRDLAFYVENREEYFQSSTTFRFLDGWFYHKTNFSIENITELSITGSLGNSTIDCNGSENAGFEFLNVEQLSIENLTFQRCGQKTIIHNDYVRSTIICNYGRDHRFYNVHVLYSRDQNIYYNNVEGNISIQQSTFAHAVDRDKKSQYVAGNSFFFSGCKSKHTDLLIEDTRFFNNNNRKGEKHNDYFAADFSSRRKGGKHLDYFAAGLSIVLKCTTVTVNLNNINLTQNEAYHGGNLAVVFYNIEHVFTSHVHIRNSLIANGKAEVGGGLFVSFVEASTDSDPNCTSIHTPRPVLELRNISFIGNEAIYGGGGFYLRQKESETYCSVAKILIENCTFKHNKIHDKGHGGVALHSITFIAFGYLQHAKPQYHLEIVNTTFSEHQTYKASGKGVIFAKTSPHVHLKNVTIRDNINCSGILGIDSNFIISEEVNISNNSASSGGGMLFCSDAVMFLTPNTTLTIAHNSAEHAGGGICIEVECLQSQPMCFFQLDRNATIQQELIETITVNLHNNTAKYAGDGLYGGSVDYCYLLDSPIHNVTANKSRPVFEKLFDIQPKGPSSVTSPPQHVCNCNATTNRCSNTTLSVHVHVYPGEKFPITVVIVGQLDGTVPGTIQALLWNYRDYDFHLGRNEEVQSTKGRNCSNPNYTVYTNSPYATLELTAQIIGDSSFIERLDHFKPFHVIVTVKECPVGFQLVRDSHIGGYLCDCTLLPILKHKRDMTCDINDQTLTRHRQFWIGYENKAKIYLYSDSLAYDYCLTSDTLVINVSNTTMAQDKQCRFNRTGILCGACPKDHSVILGSSECQKDCSNNYLSLLLFFALAGILLVFLIMFLNLTVAEGTVSGLIFYANIVQVHRAVFFQYHHYPMLTTAVLLFVSWINLDFGIPTCFYDGMTEYDKAWYQFLFPVYIWMISGVVIFLSRKSGSFARLFGSNGVQVLATLILLSYSKMLRATIATTHFQIIHHFNSSSNESISVLHWKPDANILFLKRKHIPLFIIGTIFLVISLPYTLTLLCIQCLQKVSNRRGFTWVWRLKPFFDSYTGPYSKRARFWTGFLLLTRVILLIISATNYSGIEVTNIFATIMVCTLVFVVEWALRPGIYEKRALDALECSFLVNLSVLCIVTAYTASDNHHARWAQSIIAHLSVLIAFLTFLGILVYHGYKRIRDYWSQRKQTKDAVENMITTVSEVTMDDHSTTQNALNNFPPFVRFDQDREPLLATESEEPNN